MLDLPSRRSVYRIIEELKQQGIGVVMMTNLLDEILLADTVLILDNGKVTIVTPAEIIRNLDILTQHGLEAPLLLQVAKKFNVESLRDLQDKL